MRKLKLHFKPWAVIIFLFLFYSTSKAQYSGTMYFMPAVPQVHMLNPANMPNCDFYSAIPGLGPVQMRATANTISLNDVLYVDPKIDSVINFMRNSTTQQKFIDNMPDNNVINTDFSIGLISLGFRLPKTFVSFDYSAHISNRISVPKDIFSNIIPFGPEEYIDLKDFEIASNVYHNFGMGVAYKFNDKLTVGTRVKLLYGVLSLQNDNDKLGINISPDSISIAGDLTIRGNMPFTTFQFSDTSGKLVRTTKDLDGYSAADYLNTFTYNLGGGIDLGVNYKVTNELTLSASLIDFGFIRWRDSSSYEMTINSGFSFKGFSTEMDTGITKIIDFNILDSVMNALDSTHVVLEQKPFSTYTKGRIFIGAQYRISSKLNVGALYSGWMLNNKLYGQFTLTANYQPIRLVSASLSYSIVNRRYTNIGAGLCLTLGPLNVYVITDFIPIGWTTIIKEDGSSMKLPYDPHIVDFRVGANIVFHKKKVDYPFIYD